LQLNKGKSDRIDLNEFSEMFRKRSLDLYFPRDEQRLLFEQFDNDHSSTIEVSDVINQYKDVAPTIVTTGRINEQQQKERNEKIVSKIFQERENQKLLLSPRQTTLQIVRSLRNLDPHSTGFISKDKLRWALGKEYMNIPLSDSEIDAVVELCPPDKHSGKISYDKFARMLDIRNNDPVVEPFFDARANQVTRMKNRIETLDKAINDDRTIARREQLMKKLQLGDHAVHGTVGEYDIYGPGGLSTLNKTVSCPELVLSQSPVRSRKQYEEAPRYEGEEGQSNISNSDFLTSMKLRGKGGTQHQNSVDLSDAVYPPAPGGLMPGGKRLYDVAKFDETLLQHSMSSVSSSYDPNGAPGSPSYNNYLSQSMSSDDRFNTTSSSYFAPLLYRPSVPVTRPNVMGDSMKCALERDEKRKRRYQRTAKNLQSFADFKELESISNTMNDHMRCKGRALEALQYESTAIHNDIKKFSKQQVISMQRKPNKALYDKMWGGDVEQSRKPVGRAEDRDFNTTYNGSFLIQGESSL
jgi:Ca2+-binding EF-hand superfamily protein